VDAGEQFLGKLKGVEDPEAKRKIVGEEFIHVFTKFAEKEGPFKWLAQGTLYPDVIESGVSKGPAAMIKSHHNVGGLPDWLNLEILEPLRELYKDEVREIAKILGVPEKLFMRHPFPGPGLSVRIIGEVTPTKLEISKVAMIRVVDSIDAMTADWTRLPHEVLEKMSNRITNEIEDVTWVTYTISSKPPATIEPQ
ncbi:MAG: GMP synthase (glutamine-hydrolyzing), partial [Nitrosopumilus sp.]|nr:GMP synthase (glutamine-hydrolyzing) [Nitrosopumilus sp.]